MKEFVVLAKANLDVFNVSMLLIRTTPQLEAEVLKAARRIRWMATIVFAGGGEALAGGARRAWRQRARAARARASADQGGAIKGTGR